MLRRLALSVDPFKEVVQARQRRVRGEGRGKCYQQFYDQLKELGLKVTDASRVTKWLFRDGTAQANLPVPPDTREEADRLLEKCEIEIGKWREGTLEPPKWEPRGPYACGGATAPPSVGDAPEAGSVEVGSDTNVADAPNEPPRTPLPEVDAAKFERDRAPQVAEMEYVAANLAVSNPDPEKAPSASAWSQLRFVREDRKFEQVFWQAYWRVSHQMAGGVEDVNEMRLEELIPRLSQISEDALTLAMRRLAEEAA